ncbi:hypothetical protein JDV02_008892 [Purpureocillium takamizusanense]|uniref:Uncharacterized protein n=1 Tax=Purpureocillium takamizusanense TaxID=2060973 RepID=A0A9Q8QL19_9HYPO|nr:uncharacterized protein JDV02_008892 [Purpureocillium takamizusanense]UNI23049.1 hypothetical protein JDV02_008892 [Purpureocillium takamizusanense]
MAEKLVEKLEETVGPDSGTRNVEPLVTSERAPRHAETASTSTEICESHDPRDAAHAPPSVIVQHLGPPTIEHDHPEDSTTRRHSVSYQEKHYLR